MEEIRNILYRWYAVKRRDLPWRHTTDAYKIWLSEIIMQQTQVVQGLPYYERFIVAYPTVDALANAEHDDVLKMWQGLGYYSRARNLHFAAQQVMRDYEGIFPNTYSELIKLKGIGDYTASAVASFSSGELQACVDGNVIRVISRYFGLEVPYDTSEGKKLIKKLAFKWMSKTDSATHNQAMMEFGALQCVPKSPRCNDCVLNSSCLALANGVVSETPIKSKKTKVQALFLYYFVIEFDGGYVIQQRPDSGIWRRLYEFPSLESEISLSDEEVTNYALDKFSFDESSVFSISKEYTHLLSHRKIQAKFFKIKVSSPLSLKGHQKRVSPSEFESYAISRLIERFWEDFSEDLS